MGTLCALVKRGHWLVCRSDLNLLEIRFRVLAVVVIHTINCSLVNIFPGFLASQHIVYFLPVKCHLAFELLLNNEYIRTCFAEESKVA